MPRVEILVPCFKRPEYTKMCIKALEEAQEYPDAKFHLWDDGSEDETMDILLNANLPKQLHSSGYNRGLRNVLINFLSKVEPTTELISVVGNDCLMPKNWLNDILESFDKTGADILSPNVFPSDAAFKYGRDDKENIGYRPSKIVGGLWTMKRKLIEGVHFEDYGVTGITGAFNILNQIILEKEPKIGWLPNITVQDVGHWSGNHPLHIASDAHREYSAVVRRDVSW